MVGVVGLVIYIYIINFANEGDDIQMSWIVFFFFLFVCFYECGAQDK